MKKIWNYDPVSKEISGVGYADPDPVDNPDQDPNGVWAIPAWATAIEPPEVVDGYVRVFNEATQKWGYVQVEAPIGTEPTDDPEELPEPEIAPPTAKDVNDHRDVRVRNAPFVFEGRLYQTDDESRENIMGAASLAMATILSGGGAAGDYRWADEGDDFFFISKENIRILMDAPTVIRLGASLAKFKSRIIIAANNLKTMDPIPSNYDDPDYWPALEPAGAADPYLIPEEGEPLPDEA